MYYTVQGGDDTMKKYKDKCLNNFNLLELDVLAESMRQLEKWGIQNVSSFEWMTYLTEEVGELAEAISEHEYRNEEKENIKKEAIQVATLALKIAEIFGEYE